jgi:CTP:molybdopterin cytidylyltransferase MocA
MIVVLAAGASTRFGSDKLVAQLDGRAVLEHVIDDVLRVVDAHDVTVVVGPSHDERIRLARARSVQVVVAAHADRGIRWSIDAALDAVSDAVDGIVFVLGDDVLAARVLGDVLDAIGVDPDRPIAIRRDSPVPHPVYLPRAAWPTESPTADRDCGLRNLLDQTTTWIDLPDAPTRDIDRPQDLAPLRERR